MAMSRTIPYNNPLFLVFQSRRKPGGDPGHERSGAGAGRRFVSANAKEEWADRKRRQVRDSGLIEDILPFSPLSQISIEQWRGSDVL